MKKIKIILAFLLPSVVVFAQPYGHTHYPNGSTLCSGIRTSINSDGFLMAGVYYGPDDLANIANIHIDKTNIGGAFSSPTDFQMRYQIHQGSSCGLSFGRINFFAGASVIETTPSGSEVYALAGAYQGGCFFATLDAQGDTVHDILYPFPYITSTLNISKPSIVESQNNPNTYFICGRFDTMMYALKVDQLGTIQWSHYYHSNNLYPQAILECPYTGDVVIAGWCITPQISFGTAEDGFFLRLNSTNGHVNLYKTYDGTHSISCDKFFSIATASAPSAPAAPPVAGFIIGGETDPVVVSGKAWMLKIDTSGNILWNTQMEPFSDNLAGRVTGVVERQNSLGRFEYYGICNTFNTGISGMMVLKLDQIGIPYSVFNGGSDEFFYNGSLWANSISYKNPVGGTTTDVGLHLYADDAGNHYLAEVYFNGISGCNESLTNIQNYGVGPSTINTPWIHRFGSMSTCNDFWLVPEPLNFTPGQICSSNHVVGGSNNKVIATGIQKNQEVGITSIYPNPNNGEFTIETSSDMRLTLVNELGQLIRVIELEGANAHKVSIEGLAKGIYFINGQENGTSINQKIVVTK